MAIPAFLPNDGGGIIAPSSSTDNALVRWNGADATTIQNSVVTVADTGAMAGIGTLSMASLITFQQGAAITADAYQIGRDNDATEQLHINVPNGRSFEFSHNDSAIFGTITNTAFYLLTNSRINSNLGLYFGGSIAATSMAIIGALTQTNDETGMIALSTSTRTLLIVEAGDTGFDFAHAVQTNPALFIHSSTQSTTQWIGFYHDQTDAVIDAGAGALRLNGAGFWTANGTATVTISNVAPAGVGTATISRWLTIVGDDGVTYYIPAWT